MAQGAIRDHRGAGVATRYPQLVLIARVRTWVHNLTAPAAIPCSCSPEPEEKTEAHPVIPQPEAIDPLKNWEPVENEFQALTDRLAFVRPLVPYPGWYFDIEWDNPDLAFRMRRKIWSHCQTRQIEVPVQFTWYDGIKLILPLGNDQSRQIFIGGCTEPNEFAFLDKILKPGSVFIDAGANDGLYSLFASRRAGDTGTVWAFEPSEREFGRLSEHIRINGFKNIRPSPMALSNFDGTGRLSIANHEHAGLNTLGEFIHPGITLIRKETVEVSTLDRFVQEHALQRVDAMKLDVEGEEGPLLEGARSVLENMRPVILFEFSSSQPAAKNDRVLNLLRSLEYEVYCFDPATGRPVRMEGAPVGNNLAALPQGKSVPDAI